MRFGLLQPCSLCYAKHAHCPPVATRLAFVCLFRRLPYPPPASAAEGTETKQTVKDRFSKIASSSMTNYQGRACVLRSRDGSFTVMDAGAFEEFVEMWPPADPNVVAVQAYVQGRGAQGTIFRSQYRVVNAR